MRAVPKKRVSNIATVAAPTGGIDDTSPIANMDPNYALAIQNFFPTSGALKVRWGYREYVTGLPSSAKTIMVYNDGGVDEMYACTDSGIYDITVSTATPVLVHALTNGDVVWTMFSNIAGHWLIGCNGTDPAFLFDGTTWINFTASGSPTTPGQISGLAPVDIAFVHQHKNRIWFLEEGSMVAYYWPTNAVAGAATAFPLGGIFTRGGALSALFSGTGDAGTSIEDYLVIQSDEGEVAGYGGSDPATLGSWQLAARYFLGKPLGRKTNAPLGGDTLMMTQSGAVTLSNVVGGRYRLGAGETTASGRISKTINDLVRARQFNPGWELVAAPGYQYIILKIPTGGGLPPRQLVMNSITGAWCSFDLPAVTFMENGEYIYFSDANGRVLRYGDTTVDNVLLNGTGGDPILAGFQQAYNYFEDTTTSKHFKLVRPVFETQERPNYLLTISTDFAPGGLDLLGTPGITSQSVGQWDAAVWDVGLWLVGLQAFQEWIGLQDIGYCASLIVKTTSTIELQFSAATWAFERGSSL